MKWNLRLAAANRGIWKASELQRMLADHGLAISCLAWAYGVGLRRSWLRTGCGLVGHRQVPGPPCQCLAARRCHHRQEPSGELVGRTEETLDAETEEP